MHNVKKNIAKMMVCVMGLSLVGVSSSEAEAAKKPKLSNKSVTITEKKTKKITIKNVKAKKIKSFSVKTNKKKIATVKKAGKTAFRVTAKKAGTAKITATIKLKGVKKATKLTLNVKVKKAVQKQTPAPAVTSQPTTSPTVTATSAPTATPDNTGNVSTKPTMRPLVDGDDVGEARPEASPLIDYTESFDGDMGEWDWFARYDEAQGNVASLLQTEGDDAYSGKAMRITGRDGHAWNGPALDMSGIGTPGATYRLTFYAKLPQEYSDLFGGDTLNLRVSGGYQITSTAEFIYENYPADTDYPINADTWTKYEITFTAPASFYSYIFYFETNGGGRYDFLIDELQLTRTVAPAEPDLTLASIKDTYAPYMNIMGTASSYAELMNEHSMNFIKHHYNSVTMGNSMKPDSLMGSATALNQSDAKYMISEDYSSYAANKDAQGNVLVPELTLDGIDKVLKLCYDNGLKIRIHSPIWHQQMPKFFFCEQYDETKPVVKDPKVMLAREELYIRNVIRYILTSPYAEVVNAFDVVNEYTHMSNESGAVGSENWWKYSFGTEMKTDCEYVKKAFVWAYDELSICERTDISLIYNDYNTYEPGTTEKIIELINNINTVDDVNTVGKICSGVGMQCHMNDASATVENLKTALDSFAEQGYEIQITELDVTNTGRIVEGMSAEDKAEVYTANAQMYADIMNTFLEAKKAGANISSITIWGTTDSGSWRADRAPVLFGTDISDKKPSFDAVINAALNFGK